MGHKRIIGLGVSSRLNRYPNQRGGVITTSEEFMMLTQGGLRCSVNKIPDSFITKTDVITSEPANAQ